jgi:hypothetical protein
MEIIRKKNKIQFTVNLKINTTLVIFFYFFVFLLQNNVNLLFVCNFIKIIYSWFSILLIFGFGFVVMCIWRSIPTATLITC